MGFSLLVCTAGTMALASGDAWVTERRWPRAGAERSWPYPSVPRAGRSRLHLPASEARVGSCPEEAAQPHPSNRGPCVRWSERGQSRWQEPLCGQWAASALPPSRAAQRGLAADEAPAVLCRAARATSWPSPVLVLPHKCPSGSSSCLCVSPAPGPSQADSFCLLDLCTALDLWVPSSPPFPHPRCSPSCCVSRTLQLHPVVTQALTWGAVSAQAATCFCLAQEGGH